MRHVKKNIIAATVICFALLLVGCSEHVEPTEPVSISGVISVPEGVPADGVVTVKLYHAWALEGMLRHPAEFIASFEAEVGEYEYVLNYPVNLGEGLLAYAWIDTDGDGVFCTPAEKSDLSGFAEVDAYPAETVTANLVLDTPCASIGWFYPPAPGE